MKRIISLFLFLLIFSSFSGIALATENKNDDLDIIQTSYENIISPYYEDATDVHVIANNGEDITQKFFQDTLQYYEDKNFDFIKQYCQKYVNKMSRRVEDTASVTTRASSTKSISEVFTEYPEDDILGHRILVNYTISGTYVYDRNTGKILSAYNASLKRIEYADAGAAWHFSPKNISTNASKSSDGYTAYFSASFHLYGNFSGEGVSINDADFGILGDTVEVTPGSD